MKGAIQGTQSENILWAIITVYDTMQGVFLFKIAKYWLTVVLFMASGCSDNSEIKFENALRGPVVIADSSEKMNLEQRMWDYKVANVSLAVVSGTAIDVVKA